jgi:hypothetical protein
VDCDSSSHSVVWKRKEWLVSDEEKQTVACDLEVKMIIAGFPSLFPFAVLAKDPPPPPPPTAVSPSNCGKGKSGDKGNGKGCQ